MPDEQDAQAFARIGDDHAAQLVARGCCMIQGIAVSPECRRKGVGVRIKRFVDGWAAQHGACLMLSIPTNEAACRMNDDAGYTVLPPQVPLVLGVAYHGGGRIAVYPFDGSVPESRWSFRVIAEPAGYAIRVGMFRNAETPCGRDDDSQIIEWITKGIGG